MHSARVGRTWRGILAGGLLSGSVLFSAIPGTAAQAKQKITPGKKTEKNTVQAVHPAKPDPNTVIATYRGGKLTLGEVQKGLKLRNNPYLTRMLQTLDGRRRYIERILQNRVLADEARRRGLDKDPEIRARIDAILAMELTRRLRRERANTPVSKTEAEAYFKSHPQEFNRPERKRLSQIFLRIPPNAGDDVLKKKMAIAQNIIDELKKAGAQQTLKFKQLAAKYSEDMYGRRYRGYYGMISPDTQPSARFPREVLDAAKKLTKVGQTSDIIRASDGIHILLLDGIIPAIHQTFEQALPVIRARLRSRRIMDVKMLASDIFQKADIQIHENVLKQLHVPTAPPKRHPRYTMPSWRRKKAPGIRHKSTRGAPNPPPAPSAKTKK